MAWVKQIDRKHREKTLRFGTNIFFRLKTPEATEGMICHLRCNDALEGPGCGSRHWCWGELVDGWTQTKESINVASKNISPKKYQLFRMYFEWMIPHQHLDGYICDMQNHWDSPIFTATQSIFLSQKYIPCNHEWRYQGRNIPCLTINVTKNRLKPHQQKPTFFFQLQNLSIL